MKFDDYKIKHLEMIQSIVSRMATNSFALKGWAVTLVVGIFAISAKESNSMFFILVYLPIIIFCLLDSYYLQLERKYRDLYSRTLDVELNEIDFKLKVDESDKTKETTYWQCLLSGTEFCFYVPIAVLVLIVIIIAN